MRNQKLWGIDLGGTKIEGVVLKSREQPDTLFRKRIATEGDRGYDHVLKQIQTLIESMGVEVNDQPQSIGFGTPGTIDVSSGLLRGSNSQHLNNKPLDKDLNRILGIPVVVENDANCFALAETQLGCVSTLDPQANSVFGIIMGTGVGGGLVLNNKLVTGKNRIAGEWGHTFLDGSGGNCYCGKSGCVETIISGPALEKYYANISGTHQPLTIIEAMANAGDNHAQDTINRLITFFGKSVANVINIIDPDVIVVGGGVGNIADLYTRGTTEVTKNIFSPTMLTKIVKPKLGDSAGVYGAAFKSAI